MRSKIFWIKFACWVGVVVDGAAAMILMFPALNTWISGEPSAVDSIDLRNARATAAALMWGWTVLLVWAGMRPLERYGVVAITIFPVLTWLTGVRLHNILSGTVDILRNIPILFVQVVVFLIMGFSLWNMHHDSSQKGTHL